MKYDCCRFFCALLVSIGIIWLGPLSLVSGKVHSEDIRISGADVHTSDIKALTLDLKQLPSILPSSARADVIVNYAMNAQKLLGLPSILAQQKIGVSRADYVYTHNLTSLSIVNGKISANISSPTVVPTKAPFLTATPTHTSVPPTEQMLEDIVTPTQTVSQVENTVIATPIPEGNPAIVDVPTPNTSDELLRLINEILGQKPDEGDFPIGWATIILSIATLISAVALLIGTVISLFASKKN